MKAGRLFAEHLDRLPHVFGDLHVKRTAVFTGMAADALGSRMFQDCVMFTYRLRHFPLRLHQIQELRHRRDINAHRTRRAVTAIHAMSLPADLREGSQR